MPALCLPLPGLLIGAGFFAAHHAEAWRRIEEVRILAVSDPIAGRAAAFAAKHGIPRSYEDTGKMLQTEQASFVDITTRPETHLALTKLAAEHGLHSICQKPMAPTLPECVAMCEAVEAAGVRLMIHENWRWQPWYREAKRWIDRGAIGHPRHLSFDWRTGDGNGQEPYAAQPYFRDMPRLIIYESLVHILDTFRFLAGELEITACETRRVNPAIQGEDWAEIEVRFASGCTGLIHGDRQTGPVPAPVAMGSMRIEGERGTLLITPDGELSLDGKRLDFTPSMAGYRGDSVFATQKHLIDCLRSGQASESEGRAYLSTAQLVEDAYFVYNGTISSA
jgi:predicted dehydrogenase